MHFNEANEIGKQGEAAVSAYLRSRGWLVVDTSSHELFQPMGIDFICSKGHKTRAIEVKTDRHSTGNFFIELVANHKSKAKGAIYSSADDWFYVNAPTAIAYIFSPQQMLAHIEANPQYSRKECWSYIGGQPVYKSIGVLVPIAQAPIKRKIKLESAGVEPQLH